VVHRELLCSLKCLFTFNLQMPGGLRPYQEVMCLGSLEWCSNNTSISSDGPHNCDALEELGVAQMVCSDRSLLVLSLSGKVYQMLYASKTEVILIRN
jgi:hypothetical protein